MLLDNVMDAHNSDGAHLRPGQEPNPAVACRQDGARVLLVTGGNPARAPSELDSLKSLSRAFENVGIQTILQDIGSERHQGAEAAFIRTYTELGGAAHRLAVDFETAGLPVLDRPSSIVRGCDKVHQALLFALSGVPTPTTEVLTNVAHARNAQRRIGSWPVVVKDPKGAFCAGVTVANTIGELEAAAAQHCRSSGAAVVQGFVASSFDWRIGILDHQVLFAAKYWMVPGSWKIHEERADGSRWGRCTPVPVKDVPAPVLRSALAASRAAGPGLWGVDIKFVGDEAFVIEINDNPNIDDEVEAAVEADRVWPRLAAWFSQRIESSQRARRAASQPGAGEIPGLGLISSPARVAA